MPPTLRQHWQWAKMYLSTGGVKTLIPQKGRPAPVRIDSGNRQMDKAVSIKIICEANDRTSWMITYLDASDEAAPGIWRSIPETLLCLECRVERSAVHYKGRGCPQCGRRMATCEGLVRADIILACKKLRMGRIAVNDD